MERNRFWTSSVRGPRRPMPTGIRSTLAMGVTVNHLAAIIVPVTGGLLWASQGYQLFFVAGAVVVFGSLLVTQRLPLDWRRSPTAPA